MSYPEHPELHSVHYGDSLRKARKMANLTQVEAAKRLGIAVNSLRLYEADRRLPSISTLIDMTKIYNANFLDLISSADINFQASNNNENINRLLDAFELLNPKGQRIAICRVQELTKIPDYQLSDDDPQTPEE